MDKKRFEELCRMASDAMKETNNPEVDEGIIERLLQQLNKENDGKPVEEKPPEVKDTPKKFTFTLKDPKVDTGLFDELKRVSGFVDKHEEEDKRLKDEIEKLYEGMETVNPDAVDLAEDDYHEIVMMYKEPGMYDDPDVRVEFDKDSDTSAVLAAAAKGIAELFLCLTEKEVGEPSTLTSSKAARAVADTLFAEYMEEQKKKFKNQVSELIEKIKEVIE